MTNSSRFVMLTLLLLLCGFQLTAAAMSFDDYHERVDRAVAALDELLSTEGDELVATSAPALRSFREMREALPPHSELQWNDDVSAQIDNSWLDVTLKDYEKLSAERATNENRAALESIAWRLRALDERLLEFERAAHLSGDEPDYARLNAILERMKKGRQQQEEEEAGQKTALAKLAHSLKAILLRFIDWLRELLPSLPKIQPPVGGPSYLPKVALALISAALLGTLTLLAWKLVPGLLASLRRKRFKEKREARVVLGERVEADETAADLFAEAEALARHGETRAAIRKAYIALLCELGDRKILRLEQHKTNRDYLQALLVVPALYAEVQPLTNNYETIWYGRDASALSDWDAFRKQCQQALGIVRLK